MLRFLKSLFRVLFGFALACLVAGLVTVLFVDTPVEIAGLPAETIPAHSGSLIDLALLTATHSAIFAFAFALIAAVIAYWLSINTLPFYLIAGTAIALLGFYAQYQSEVAGQPTILNNYALKAFLTAGFFAGLTYWLAAGRYVGIGPDIGAGQLAGDASIPQSAAAPEASAAVAPRQSPAVAVPAKRMMPSVSSRIIDITTDNSTTSAIGAAAAASAAAQEKEAEEMIRELAQDLLTDDDRPRPRGPTTSSDGD